MTEHHQKTKKPGIITFLLDNSLFLIGGAILALVWANVSSEGYHQFIHFDVMSIVRGESAGESEHAAPAAHVETATASAAAPVGGDKVTAPTHHGMTIHFIVNDILMALFFAIAAKEVWESMLPGGALSNPRKAATPLLATAGGVMGPAVLYLLGAFMIGQTGWFGQEGVLGRGWAVPCATDIAFSYLIARMIFGRAHPAIAFLLLLAIADDAAGLIILAIAYPQAPIQPIWFLLTFAAIALCFVFRKMRLQNFWWYLLIPGAMSWFSFYFAGIHAALGLVPVIPCFPHAHTDLGIFAQKELNRKDTLSEFEEWWKNPVELILGLFGLTNAGVAFGNMGAPTVLIMGGLLIGKPLGITLFTWMAEKWFRLQIPSGMNYRHIVTLGAVAGIGFTVALFVSDAAFPSGQFSNELRDSVKMGALASFLAAVVGFACAKLLGVKKLAPGETLPGTEPIKSPPGMALAEELA